ncbi:MAG: AbrB/MazE/SpoVT family DNA-binding domain-containing protein [Oscillospiraceae bacterium]|nr:AbrB/MazE/SpoVT family DNA-binding domain-containing protein [Oscillospiraceae bacterium]
MKATGIVRRIDDLGRVVIPKEIRRTMRIREGDPLEIYTDSNGEVIFKKYSLMGELSSFAHQYCDVLFRSTNIPVAICDRDHVIAVSGMPKKDIIDKRVSQELEKIMESRESFTATGTKTLTPVDGISKNAIVACPIIGAGDISGSVVFFQNEDSRSPSQTEIKLAQVAASFLGKQMEE